MNLAQFLIVLPPGCGLEPPACRAKVGATVMVATTHEDLKNALRPDMQITKHYKERVKVDYAD